MARRGKKAKRDIETYAHTDKERMNNPPVGLVTPETDRDASGKIYAHDPHLDLQLVWAGKAEHTSFEVPTTVCRSRPRRCQDRRRRIKLFLRQLAAENIVALGI